MLPEYLKNRIEIRFGKEIRYHKDCEALSAAITQFCGATVSTSTIKRLFGIDKSDIAPRKYTLSILAQYVGIENWEYGINQGVLNENLFTDNPGQLAINKLAESQIVKLHYNSHGNLHIKYLGSNVFSVIESSQDKLIVKDLLTILRLENSFPLVCEKVIRGGRDLGKYVGGKDEVLVGFEITKLSAE